MSKKNLVTRRDFLRFSALGVGSSVLTACAVSWEGEIYGVPVEVNAVGSMTHVPTQDVEAG